MTNNVNLTSIFGIRIPYVKFESMLLAARRYPSEFFDAFDEVMKGADGVENYREKEKFYFESFQNSEMTLKHFFNSIAACTKVEFFATVADRYFHERWNDIEEVGENIAALTELTDDVLRLHFTPAFCELFDRQTQANGQAQGKKRSLEEGNVSESKRKRQKESEASSGSKDKSADVEEEGCQQWLSVVAAIINLSSDEFQGNVSDIDFKISEIVVMQKRIAALFKAGEKAWKLGKKTTVEIDIDDFSAPEALTETEADMCVVSSVLCPASASSEGADSEDREDDFEEVAA